MSGLLRAYVRTPAHTSPVTPVPVLGFSICGFEASRITIYDTRLRASRLQSGSWYHMLDPVWIDVQARLNILCAYSRAYIKFG